MNPRYVTNLRNSRVAGEKGREEFPTLAGLTLSATGFFFWGHGYNYGTASLDAPPSKIWLRSFLVIIKKTDVSWGGLKTMLHQVNFDSVQAL